MQPHQWEEIVHNKFHIHFADHFSGHLEVLKVESPIHSQDFQEVVCLSSYSVDEIEFISITYMINSNNDVAETVRAISLRIMNGDAICLKLRVPLSLLVCLKLRVSFHFWNIIKIPN